MMEKVLEVPLLRDICGSSSLWLGESWIFGEIRVGKLG